jgi:hypothetical protein
MADEILVYVDTYADAIRFGTGITNPSDLAFDAAQRLVSGVNELKPVRSGAGNAGAERRPLDQDETGGRRNGA